MISLRPLGFGRFTPARIMLTVAAAAGLVALAATLKAIGEAPARLSITIGVATYVATVFAVAGLNAWTYEPTATTEKDPAP